MKFILERNDYVDLNECIYELNTELNNYDLTYDEIIDVLYECDFTEEDVLLYLAINEGFLDKLKSAGSAIKSGYNNVKDKVNVARDKVKNVAYKVKDTAGRVKDHVKRHKYKYGLAAAALTGGAGLAYAPLALGAGHFFDKHSR